MLFAIRQSALSNIVAFLIAAALIGCDEGRPPTATKAPALDIKSIEAGLRVSGEAATGTLTNTVALSTFKFQQATIDLNLLNDTKYSLQLGDTLLFLQVTVDGSSYSGSLVRVRVPQTEKSKFWWRGSKSSYGVAAVATHYDDGTRFTFGGSMDSMFAGLDEHKKELFREDTVPAALQPRTSQRLRLTLRHSDWLKDEATDTIRVALPEIRVDIKDEDLRFRGISVLRRKPGTQNKWQLDHTKWIAVNNAGLELQFRQPNDVATMVLLANWWMDFDAKTASLALANMAKTQNSGNFLRTCMRLLGAYGYGELADHASLLLAAKDSTSPGIKLEAAQYLVTIKRDPDLKPLYELAAGTDNEVARLTILTLGGLKTSKAKAVLEELLANKKLQRRHKQIEANLKRG